MREVGEGCSVQSLKWNTDQPRERIIAPHNASLDVHDRDPDRGVVEGEVEQRKPYLGPVLREILFLHGRLHSAAPSSDGSAGT